ncbi:MAG: acyl-CoA dehydrogenase [Chloroflexota bacterium]|nr:acyl-CoA dehydrogenase [Dehalococcoidia bacterium]MDW8253497.1 acyl-CoA dehydrogenase [Chloroflexota bacterium]
MDFRLTEEQQLFQRNVREFVDREIAPTAAEIDEHARFPEANLKKIADLGLIGLGIPSAYGGSDGDSTMVAIAIEEIARGCASTSTVYAVTLSLCNHVIWAFGNEDQKRRYVPALSRGERLGCYGLTEPEAGSDAASLRTRARRDGDDYVITGTKQFISNGDRADTMILFATVNPELRSRGITAFIVETNQPGYTVLKVEKKLGIRGSSTAALALENVRVPASNRLGEEGEGFKIAMQVLDSSRIGIAAQAVGIAQAAFEAAVSYARERRQFGRPIADNQAIQFMLADMRTRLEAARLLTLRAADMHDRGLKHSAETSMAKLFASEVAEFITSKAIQIHGGYGYLRDFPVERYYRDARITQIYEGTSEVQRIVIARDTLSR